MRPSFIRRYASFLLLPAAMAALCALFWIASGRPAMDYTSAWGMGVGLLSWLLLWALLLAAMQVSGVRLTRGQLGGVALATAAALVYFAFQIRNRQFIYYFDYGHYYQKQIAYEYYFTLGPLSGLKNVFEWGAYGTSYDYTNYICLFVELPYAFTPKTGDWYTLSCCAAVLPPLFTAMAALVSKCVALFHVRRGRLAFALGFLGCASIPLLYQALSYGQPDLIGLIFVAVILLLTLDYWFERPDIPRWLLLIAAVYLLIVCRRWYAYWLTAYVACYAVSWVLRLLQKRERKLALLCVRNALFFLLPSLFLLVVTLWPMLEAVMGYDYALHYAAYLSGGFLAEAASQADRLGWLVCALFAIGAAWALRHKKSRRFALIAILTCLISLVMFTRVQNMGAHHSLLLMPCYFFFMIFFGCAVAGISRNAACRAGAICTAAALTVQLASSLVPVSDFRTKWLPGSVIPTPDRNDMPQVEEVARWIDENVSHGEIAYMIPHGEPYNPDVFRNALLPDVTVRGKLSYGAAVLGTHSFPTDLLDAVYVLTCDPFCPLGFDAKINAAFLAALDSGIFSPECSFDMGNGYVFTAYRRLRPADRSEALHYLSYLEEENRQFPDQFESVAERWLEERGL